MCSNKNSLKKTRVPVTSPAAVRHGVVCVVQLQRSQPRVRRANSAAAPSASRDRASGAAPLPLRLSVAAILSPVELRQLFRCFRGFLEGRKNLGKTATPTALRDVDVDVGRLGVSGAAGVVAGVAWRGAADGQRRLRLGPRLGEHAHARCRVVVDHARVVVPEHVLRRHRALRKRGRLASSRTLCTERLPQHCCSSTS